MPRLQDLASRSLIQNLGLQDIMNQRRQEAVQLGNLERLRGQADLERFRGEKNIPIIQEQGRQKREAENRDRNASFLNVLATIGGAAGGFWLGGPMGAKLGASLGGMLGKKTQGADTLANLAVQGTAGLMGRSDELITTEDKLNQLKLKQSQADIGKTEADIGYKEAQTKSLIGKPGRDIEKQKLDRQYELEDQKTDYKHDLNLETIKHKNKVNLDNIKRGIATEKEEKKFVENYNLDRRNLDNMNSNLSNYASKVDELLLPENSKYLKSATGVSGKLGGWLPGTKSTDIRAIIDELKSTNIVTALSQMRSSNKTGGGVGNVTEGELKILGDTIANLNPNVSYPIFVKNLKKSREVIQGIMERANSYSEVMFPNDEYNRIKTKQTRSESGQSIPYLEYLQ